MKRVILRLMKVFVALFMVGMLVTVSAPQPVMAETGVVVDVVLLPASQTVVNGDTFDIIVEARCSEQELGSIAANLDYDHDYLEVQSITDGLRFPNVVSDFAVAGEINFTGMTTSFFPHDTFTVYTVTFLATDLTASTTISFHTAMDMRKTDAMKAGSKLRSTTGATVTITPGTLVSIEVTPAVPTIFLGHTQQFSAIGTYDNQSTANITDLVNWTSTNEAIATIQTAGDANPGLAISLAVGTTTMTATLYTICGNTTLTVTEVEEEAVAPPPEEEDTATAPPTTEEESTATAPPTTEEEEAATALPSEEEEAVPTAPIVEEEVLPEAPASPTPAPIVWWIWPIVGIVIMTLIGVIIWLVLRRRGA